MTPFRAGHATHPRWAMALDLALAQIQGTADPEAPGESRLGIVYLTEAFQPHLSAVLATLRERTGVHHWTGACAPAICATGAEYADEPAIALMVVRLPAGGFRRFPERADTDPAGMPMARVALVHADPRVADLPGRVESLAARTRGGFLFGAIASDAERGASRIADEALDAGLGGIAFGPEVALHTRVTQGCSPLASEHRITATSGRFVAALDGRPALDMLLQDLGVRLPAGHDRDGEAILRALPAERLRNGLFVGLARGEAGGRPGFGDFEVRSVVGIDPSRRLIAVSDMPQEGARLVFCTRDREAAHRDLVRIVAELRDEVDDAGQTVLGALYHSCVARGAHLFGSQGAELGTIRHHLGDVPLVGMYGLGEIAGSRIHGHTGVLTLFVA